MILKGVRRTSLTQKQRSRTTGLPAATLTNTNADGNLLTESVVTGELNTANDPRPEVDDESPSKLKEEVETAVRIENEEGNVCSNDDTTQKDLGGCRTGMKAFEM
ncbi:hypothetical protein DPMN_124918 [Dreissena polymorpha]|uniref:Uncharacterized protein n=1 Tax=Dreissena polymorpha TaxID=45954 RepID=A0A9D4GTG9_DREPO|nr:hypothetical protein DPMN_124918 [Dreissena polymorpha]